MESPLARFGWLAHVDADFRSFLLRTLQIREVSEGQTITHAGDDVGGLYAVVEGQIAFLATFGLNAAVINYMGYPGSWWGQAPVVGLPRVGHLRRLAATLLRLGGNRHRRFPVDVPDAFLLTREELAGAIGLARNATGRLLRRLEADGLVDARYGRIRLRHPARLEALVDAA